MIKPATTKTRRALLSFLETQFGIKKNTLKGELLEDQKGRIFLTTKYETNLKTVSQGMYIAKQENTIRPSTNLIQSFYKHITKNKVQLTKEETIRFIAGEDIMKEAPHGYQAVFYNDTPLGIAHAKNNRLKNMTPKGRRIKVEYL